MNSQSLGVSSFNEDNRCLMSEVRSSNDLSNGKFSTYNSHLTTFNLRQAFLRTFFTALFLIPLFSFAQTPVKKTRILFLLDASSSMTYPWTANYTRFEVASNILLKIMDSVYSVNNEIEFAVRAYGTMYPAQAKNCIDTKLEVPFNLQNTNQIKTRLKNLTPVGSSPIAYSLSEASENELNDVAHFDYSVIFITDGGESCNGDVCDVYQKLLQKKISIKPYIIGLDRNENLKSYYECLGNYIEVSTPEDIEKAINLILDANKSIIEKPKLLKLVTTFSNTPAIKDTVKKVEVAKKDTIVPPPVVVIKDTPIVKKLNTIFPKLKWQQLSKRKNEMAVANKFPYRIEKIKKVILHIDFQEDKKTSAVFANLSPMYTSFKKSAKPSVTAKKLNISIAKKATLHFDYEEPKKTSPVFAYMMPIASNTKLKPAKPSVTTKKLNLKIAKTASLHFEYDEPKKVSPVFASLMPIYSDAKLKYYEPIAVARKLKLIPAKKATLHFEIELPKKENLVFLKYAAYPRRLSYANRVPSYEEMQQKIAKLGKQKVVLHFKVDETKPLAKKDTVLASGIPLFPPGNSVEFTTEVAASKETMVQVYFKGPNGKTYPTAKPQIIMQDAKTNLPVTSFKREMTGAEPVAQKVIAGTYNLVVKGFDDLYANNIVIVPNTTTKVIVKVSEATLQFRYKGNIRRPISEFKAKVVRRFAAGGTVIQKCTDMLTYEPGTYFVEVNCLPVYSCSIDLTFGEIYEIQINEPGFLMIMNTTPLGKVQLQVTLGDQFVTFYTMNVTGNIKDQKIQLLSGSYKLIYPADPRMPQAGNKELLFKINPDNQTELELK